LPPVFQRPSASIFSTILFVFIGLPARTSTFAAASSALNAERTRKKMGQTLLSSTVQV